MKRKYIKQIFLLTFTFTIFINSLPNDFIFDDIPLVKNSIYVSDMGFWDLVSSYRPLRYLTYAFDYHIFGMSPWGFRLMNIFYHSLTVLSLFWMLKVFGLSKRAAFIASLVFAIHPVHTDSASYISGRRDVLMGLFYVQSIGWFMKFYNTTQPPSPLLSEGKKGEKKTPLSEREGWSKTGVSWRIRFFYLILSLLFLFLSISSKEMGATIPLIFLLYIFYKDGSKLLKKRWFYIASLSLLLVFSFFVFFAISSGGSGLVSLEGVKYHGNSPEVHYLTASTIWLHYLKLSVFPLALILDNANYPLVTEWNFKVFFSILSMFVYGWVIWRLVIQPQLTPSSPSLHGKEGKNISPLSFFERERGWGIGFQAIAFWMIFFVISLGPVLQIIPLHEIVAVHYLYVPVIAFCAIVGILFYNSSPRPPSLSEKEGGEAIPLFFRKRRGARGEFFGRIHRFAPTILLILLLFFFSIRTITRNFELKDHWTVFHADEKWAPLSFRGLSTLGSKYIEMKFPDKAAEYYKKAESTGAWDGILLSNIIGYFILKGNHKDALGFYEEMKKKKEFIMHSGTLNVAVLYMLNGNCDKAVNLTASFNPLRNHLKRIEIVKKCSEYHFEQFDLENTQDIYHKQEMMKDLGLEIERKPYLIRLINSREFSGEELVELVHELAVVNLQSDIPEAIKYYKMERSLYKKLNKPVPEIVDKSIKVLEDYKYKVLVEGKYYKLAY